MSPVIDPCQTQLRGRRRSSALHPNSFPYLFTGATIDDAAVHDEPHSPPSIPSNAHLPDLATKFTVPRHFDTNLSPIDVSTPTTPSLSRKASFDDLLHGNTPLLKPRLDRLKWRLAAAFFTYFLCGWGDGVTATVLPYFMADFHLSSMTSSLLFLGSTCGFAAGSFTVERLLIFLGRFDYRYLRGWLFYASPHMDKKVSKDDIVSSVSQARFVALMIGCVLHTSFFLIMASRSGLPAIFFAYAAAAFARALWTAPLNAYFTQGPVQSMGISYGLWSFGGVFAPLTAQAIIAKGIPWPNFYYGSMIISGLNFAFLLLTYRPTTNELFEEQREALYAKRKGSDDTFSEVHYSIAEDDFSSSATVVPLRRRKGHTLRLTLSLLMFWALAIMGTLYTGSETCTVGFMVTFLLQARYANPSAAGYVTSGFWGGITIGRFLSGYVSQHLTYTRRKYLIQVNLVIALVMHILIWWTPSVFGNALCASIIGLLYGPIYPALLIMATDVLPDEVHLVSMAIISTTASAGSALLSFVLGTILKMEGVHAMSYMTVPLAAALATWWAFLPSHVPGSRVRQGI